MDQFMHVRVARTISHECAQRTTEILVLPREHKIHIFMVPLLYGHFERSGQKYTREKISFNVLIVKNSCL